MEKEEMAAKQTELPSSLDSILSKYVAVWIWSIVLGSAAAVTYTLPRAQEFFDYGTLGIGLVAIYLMVGATALIALASSLIFLRIFIIPVVILQKPLSELTSKHGARQIYRAAMFLIIAASLRVFLGIAMAMSTVALN